MKIYKFTLVFLIFLANLANAQEQNNKLVINYPLLDLPFAIHAGKTVNSTIANPNAKTNLFKGMQYFSMEQSLQLSAGVSNSLAYGVSKIHVFEKHKVLKKITQNVIAFPIFTIIGLLPYGPSAWMHEEWHRALMASSFTNSYNPITFYKKNKGNNLGFASVSYVLDENLVYMKENDNPNFVRLATAGVESEIKLTSYMQEQFFFMMQSYQQHSYIY